MLTLINYLQQILLTILFLPFYFFVVSILPQWLGLRITLNRGGDSTALCILYEFKGQCFKCPTGKLMCAARFCWPSLSKCTEQVVLLSICGFSWKFHNNQTHPYIINSLLLFFLWLDLQPSSICSSEPYSVLLPGMNGQFLFYFLRSFVSSLS